MTISPRFNVSQRVESSILIGAAFYSIFSLFWKKNFVGRNYFFHWQLNLMIGFIGSYPEHLK